MLLRRRPAARARSSSVCRTSGVFSLICSTGATMRFWAQSRGNVEHTFEAHEQQTRADEQH
jgi:hypothetical protein